MDSVAKSRATESEKNKYSTQFKRVVGNGTRQSAGQHLSRADAPIPHRGPSILPRIMRTEGRRVERYLAAMRCGEGWGL